MSGRPGDRGREARDGDRDGSRRQGDSRGRASHGGRAPGGSGRPQGPRGPRARSEQRPSERARAGDPARLAAYTVLRAVDEGGYANLELPRLLRGSDLEARDAAFATELTYGTLRWRGFYDAVVTDASGRGLDAIDPPVLDTLRLGAHQILGMRVPAHAAVGETVGLARQVNGAGAAGFVNAVLRRVSERSREEWLDRVAPAGADEVAVLGARHSHPEWVVRALRTALLTHGAATAADVHEQLEALLEADNEPADVMLVARPGLVDVADLVDLGAVAATVSPVGASLPSGDPGHLAPVRDGRAAVQDEGSQLLALALAAVEVAGDDYDEEWLDLCAGPGGKAGLLAALAVDRAYLTANEISPHRADLVRQGLRAAVAAGARVEVRVGDGRDVGLDEPGRYDRVLVDAPCTGLGALRRRPDARWRRTPADLAELTRLQRELLASALDATRSGGVVGYATCSPHANETVHAVADVLKGRDDVEVLDAQAALRAVAPAVTLVGEGPHAQLWPHVNATDGMFLALLRRR